jgi:hypothetical protein
VDPLGLGAYLGGLVFRVRMRVSSDDVKTNIGPRGTCPALTAGDRLSEAIAASLQAIVREIGRDTPPSEIRAGEVAIAESVAWRWRALATPRPCHDA